MRNAAVGWLKVAVLAMLSGSVALGAEPSYTWRHVPQKSFTLCNGDTVIWQLRLDHQPPYLDPVCASNGARLSAVAPPDHHWHFGLWHSWKFLDGVNFWDWHGRKEPQCPGRTVLHGSETVATEPQRAVIQFDLDYRVGVGPSAGKNILRERRTIEARIPRSDGSYTLDWTLAFTALDQDVTASSVGYGGLGLRGPQSVKDIQAFDSEGRRGAAACAQRARWLDYSAVYAPGDKLAGTALFDHPGNPRFPTYWWVCADSVTAYMGTAFVCKEPYTIKKGETLTLRYRTWVHDGRGDAHALQREWQSFAAQR
jgi:hypothetical protein